MNNLSDLSAAMLTSRDTDPSAGHLPAIFSAERCIANMPAEANLSFHKEFNENPDDPFLSMWHGLVLANEGKHSEAITAFLDAMQLGCNHWRVAWYLAKAAKDTGDVELVDKACAGILHLNPEFWFARELPKHARGYYAQIDQDKFIEKFFQDHPSHKNTFVEVGAFDGVHYSNVRRLHECYGWTGVCIEPVQKNFKKLRQSYENTSVRCIHAAIGLQEGEAEINVSTYPHLPDWGSDVASLSDAELIQWTRLHDAHWAREPVNIRPLSAILDELDVGEFDLLSLDVEGFSLQALQSLDFSKYSPMLVVVEYGQDRNRILRFLTDHGYALALDNGQDLFMAQIPQNGQRLVHGVPSAKPNSDPKRQSTHHLKPQDYSELHRKLNPHLLTLIPIEKATEIVKLDPILLLNTNRFDLMAKYIYAKNRLLGVESDWATQLYDDHIRVFNGHHENDGSGKKTIFDFLKAFDLLLDGIKDNGFDESISLVPIDNQNVIIDGAHRLAACLLYNKPVHCVRFDTRAESYSFQYFENGTRFAPEGLKDTWCDAMAFEYCGLNKNTFVVAVFPSATGKDLEIEEILAQYGHVYYKKSVHLFNHGPLNLIKQMYKGESWLGEWKSSYAGALGKATHCFANEGPVRVYLFETDRLDEVKTAKEQIRGIFNIGNHSVHINDSYAETIRLAQLLLNNNSIHFLNYAHPVELPKFHKLITSYFQWLETQGMNKDYFCVDGSGPMAAYGMREPGDLDFLHYGYHDISTGNGSITSHNTEAQHHVTTIDDIIFNPENHFYFEGVKFVSLDIIQKMKDKRGEPKDKQDILFIDTYLKNINDEFSKEQDINFASPEELLMNDVLPTNTNSFIDECNRKAEELVGQGNLEDALKILEQIVAINPKDISALNSLGVIAFQTDRIDDAVTLFTRALEIDDSYFEALENLGKCLEKKGRYSDAIEWFEKALKAGPVEVAVLNSLGHCYIQEEALSEAENAYMKSLELNGQQDDIKQILHEIKALKDVVNKRKGNIPGLSKPAPSLHQDKLPMVTVITATTGDSRLIRSIESIQKQTYVNLEHMIVVDGQEHREKVDNILRNIEKPTRIQFHVLQLPYATGKNKWVCHRINGSIPFLCNSDLVSFLDEDNWFEPEHVESLVSMIHYGKLDWAFALRNIVDEDGRFVTKDLCENLGNLHHVFQDPKDYHVDTNSYMFKRNLAIQFSHIWNRPARPQGMLEADRAMYQCLSKSVPNFAGTCKHSVNYTVGNRSDSVQAEFFLHGNKVMRAAYPHGLPWERPAKSRDLYILHFNEMATTQYLALPQKKPRSYAYEEWQLTLLDEFAENYNIKNGYTEDIPSGATVLTHMCHPETLPRQVLERKDITKIAFTIEGPNIRHQKQWQIDFLKTYFDQILTYWTPLLNDPFATFFPFPHRLDLQNPQDLRYLFRPARKDKSVCIVMANRPLEGAYVINGIELQCLDRLRADYVRALGDITCYGMGWEAFQNHPTVKVGGILGSYRDTKANVEILKDYTFTLIIENCDADGYVSEKIYDAFAAGSIPLYCGNINKRIPIPDDMYIDLKKYGSPQEFKRYLDSLSEKDISYYQEAIMEKRESVLDWVSPKQYYRRFNFTMSQ